MVQLIFDLDGCLIESTEVQKAAYYGSYKEVVGDDNCPPFEEYLKYTGDSIKNVMKKLGLPEKMVEPYRRISSASIDKIILNNECIDLIRDFRKKGSKIGLCTGKDHYRTDEILKYFRIDNLFEAIICSDDVTEPKPSGMPIERVVDLMRVSKNDCIYIGDGFNDMLSAQNAGIRFIFSTWYVNLKGDHKNTYVADNVKQLYNILRDEE